MTKSISTAFSVLALATAAGAFLTVSVLAQQTKVAAAKPHAKIDVDALPDEGSDKPDPLTPTESASPAPLAPGAAAAPSEADAAKAAADAVAVDPVIAEVRTRTPQAHPKPYLGVQDDLAGLKAYYAGAAKPVFATADGVTASGKAAAAEIARADDYGLRAKDFELPDLPGGALTPAAAADIEVKLALAVLKYARDARGGRVDPKSISLIFDQKPAIFEPRSVLQGLAKADAADTYLKGLHPHHPQFEALRQALLKMRTPKVEPAADKKELPQIPTGPKLRAGDQSPQVAALRERLGLTAAAGADATLFDQDLEAALKAYQEKHGLTATGQLDIASRRALNREAHPEEASRGAGKDSEARIIANMERWRWMPPDLGDFYIMDSVTEQLTRVIDHGKVALTEKIVVGKPDWPTPVFSADLKFIIFHPEWGVPDGIKQKELLPRLLRTGDGGWFSTGPTASDVLRAQGLRISMNGHEIDPDSVDWHSADIRRFDFIQGAGSTNVLGIVKFRFPNKHDVYMHDTPDRHLFGGSVRAFSHGCMRVQNPVQLAEVLLAHDKGWSTGKVAEYESHGGEITMSARLPVHITYFTAIPDETGAISYKSDIYGLDERVYSAITGGSVHIASVGPTSEDPPGSRASRSVVAVSDDDEADAPKPSAPMQKPGRAKGPRRVATSGPAVSGKPSSAFSAWASQH